MVGGTPDAVSTDPVHDPALTSSEIFLTDLWLGATVADGRTPVLNVWIDQDLCTGDGLCTDHCPELFVLLEDGISYVVADGVPQNDPGRADSMAPVASDRIEAAVAAAEDCPGECIFLEEIVETVPD